MPKPDPNAPGDGPNVPEDEEHGAKLAQFFSELEREAAEPKMEPPQDQMPDANQT